MGPFIELQNVSKIYRTGNIQYTALTDINKHIDKGSYVAITGKSGSGKSTLLNMITGIDNPSSGTITISNEEISNFNEQQLTKWRGRNIGIVFQFFQLLPTISIIDNLVLAMDFVGKISKSKRKSRASELLEITGIVSHAYKYPGELSGGEQQRAAISRALVNNPEIIIADEPTGNLDSVNSQIVIDIFKQLHHQGKTIITVTHDQIDTSQYDEVIRLSDGKIIEQ